MLKHKNSTHNLKSIRKQGINEKKTENDLDNLILETFSIVRKRIKTQWQEEEEKAGIKSNSDVPNPNSRRGGIKRKLTHASSINLLHAAKRGKDEDIF